MKSKVRTAFEAVCSGYSPDRVVVDPELNKAFLETCRSLGLSGSAATLNRDLLNLRKRGGLRGLRSRRTSFSDEDQYRFAAEMAARFIERRDGVSVDDIVCDPELAQEFDDLTARISPGFSSVAYRWAALNLRKAKRLKPEPASRVVNAESTHVIRVADIDLAQVPCQQGLYIFFSASSVLYVGEAENLHNRIRKHLDHSDCKGLARWLWEQGTEAMHVELQILPATTTTRVRRALETELIVSRSPLFNIRR